MRASWFVVLLVACGGTTRPATPPVANVSPDSCPQLIERSERVVSEEAGFDVEEWDREELVRGCRDWKEPELAELVACVQSATGDAAVRACWLDGDLRHDARAHRVEAIVMLGRLASNAKAQYQAEGRFSAGTAGPTPASSCCGKRCGSSEEWQQSPLWNELDFAPFEPTYFQYSYEGDGATFRIVATADLDCDGTPATYVLEGKGAEDYKARVTLTPPPLGTY